MKVLVTGCGGQLGHDVVIRLRQAGLEAVGVDVQDFDLTDEKAVMDAVTTVKPDAIIHCAAYTAVDRAEQEADRCCRINGMGTQNLVRAAVRLRAKFLYISTDYVFSGEGVEPYEVNEPRRPKNIYGQSKLQGELAVMGQMTAYFIVRTSWVFGINGRNFVRTMLRLGEEKEEISVVADQIGSPTYSWDLAGLLVEMIQTEKYGVYHATNEGFCSWAEFAEKIMQLAGLPCRVRQVTTSEYKTDAQRPLNSRLSKASLDAAGFARLPDWEDALARYLLEIRTEKAEAANETALSERAGAK